MFQISSSIVNQLNLALPVGVAARQAISDLQISCFDPYFFFLLTSTYYTTMTRCPNALLYLGQYFHYYLIYYGYKFLNQSFAYVNSLCYGMRIYVLQSLTNEDNKNGYSPILLTSGRRSYSLYHYYALYNILLYELSSGSASWQILLQLSLVSAL